MAFFKIHSCLPFDAHDHSNQCDKICPLWRNLKVLEHLKQVYVVESKILNQFGKIFMLFHCCKLPYLEQII